MMAPVIEKLAEEYEGKADIGKLNVEDSMDIAGKYGVMNVPTLIIFKGGQIVKKFVGAQNAGTLKRALDEAL